VRVFLNGVVFTLAILFAAVLAGVYLGVMPAAADSKPPALEKWAANTSLHATLARETPSLSNRLQPTDANLADGLTSYGQNCAVCHGSSDGKPSKLTQGFYIGAPQLAKDGVEDDPEAVSYWKIAHGIRFTAMPSFKGTLSDDEMWKLAMFLRHMDKLPPAVDAQWKRLPSASAATP